MTQWDGYALARKVVHLREKSCFCRKSFGYGVRDLLGLADRRMAVLSMDFASLAALMDLGL